MSRDPSDRLRDIVDCIRKARNADAVKKIGQLSNRIVAEGDRS
ncbi:unannotated protein [freshwater metagenome]|uniref:Unannotated protein n=1 Tax=freshwater metagenome TaxID=449393 RepID=A0A6J7J7I1_9ZZZZ